jgi:branched-chain amino acid transport system substrate-binding protein
MKKLYIGLATAAAALTAAVPSAFPRYEAAARPHADPGVSSRSITIGTTLPLSGPASLYARIGTGMRTYFSHINARRAKAGHRGVYGRQINLRIYDDQYSENLTVQQTRRAVEQDRVFAMLGGLGTENQQAVRAYLNQRKVPQLYVSTGLSEFGRLIKRYPWTIGWQPDYVQEGRLLARYYRQNLASTRVAVLRQNDDYGREFLQGFTAVAGAGRIAAVETYPRNGGATVIPGPTARLRASGADTLLVIATPTESITALVTAFRIGWRPNKLVNSVGATDTFMTAVRNATGSTASVDGVVSTTYLKDPSAPQYANDPQARLYKRLMEKYAPNFPAPRDDFLFFYGMAKADTFVQALYRAGRNPTRASVMRAARNLKVRSPWLLRGPKGASGRILTSANSAFPIRFQRLRRYNGTSFREFGSLVKTR